MNTDFSQFLRLETKPEPQMTNQVSMDDLAVLVQIIVEKDQLLEKLGDLNFQIEDRTEIDGCVRVYADEDARPILSQFELNGTSFVSAKSNYVHTHWELPLKQLKFFNKF